MNDRPILIIDAFNLFVRAFCAYPTVSTLHGQQMGGAIGFCKTLGKICDLVKPRMIYVCWEGGGSTKRRKIYSEYKMNRAPEKLNRFYEDDIPESDENRKYQIQFLLSLLKKVPVCQLYVSDCEGDDLVAYLCRGKFRYEDKIIASSDKDLYQLMDDKTQIYNLHRKTIITKETVFEDFRVQAYNFAIAKSICGDASDNIPGVERLGYKTLMKHVPFLGLEQEVILEDVFAYCASHQDNKSCKRIFESQDLIKRNWRLIYLDDHTLTNEQAKKIDYVMESYKPKMHKIEFLKLLAKEGINSFDPTWFFYSFNSIENIEF